RTYDPHATVAPAPLETCPRSLHDALPILEPDKMFVDVCRKYFPDNACGLDDIRVRVYYEDGLRFLRGKEDEYDLIINDCTDPLGDRKSTRLNSSHVSISYAVFCLKKNKQP